MGWYSEVSRDISKIPSAVQFFEDELLQGRLDVKLKGNVERAAAEMPGMDSGGGRQDRWRSSCP